MASFSVPCPKTSALSAPQLNPKHNPKHRSTSLALFQSDFKPTRALVSGSSTQGFQATKRNQNGVMKVSAQLNEVAQGKPLNSSPALEKSEESTKLSSIETTVPDVESITAFMNQVAGLVELVDSRDIMELQLKQEDCEVLIRKKEALAPPPTMMMQSSQPQAMFHSQPPPPQAALASSAPATSASVPALPAPAKPKSSHPPLKCPMAGTFYRSPAPGAPAFVKVGDKVQKGQVICIIEAMKLMNEIEADQSGTVVDIIAEDGKPVSLDTPLLVIEP
ncbi:biotin carboxyl carrier protein of acetyl-CoA carboxylase 1, chloroplastic-like [Cynara cardunculus var. scolymus]|uniref:biotin carboxyl carrier protein of acetyl-CoA carboxylase 1, chloroplastic-like n=1 Tax=Cynara cardunculus var. scolymus TaxID=59895 RepID=UPI000D62CEEB|nr:biotin carboxyl carrier protein of acetyl-CoA carboxylase 1, chloroplastic-like [Cynara cardunculus var. scolymus]